MTLRVTLDPAALDARETWPTALAVSTEANQENTMHNLDDFQMAILNHTILQLAGLQGEAHAEALRQRVQQLTGMLELARRLGDDPLVRVLEMHRNALLNMLK